MTSGLLDELSLATSLAKASDDFAVAETASLIRAFLQAASEGSAAFDPSVLAELGRLLEVLSLEGSTDREAALTALPALIEGLRTSPVDRPREPASVKAAAVVRDAETVELVNDFLTESDDSLTKADEILMSAEQGDVGAENVNALFRVFHTIKGVAGFLDLFDIVGLAHTTETLLDHIREGRLVLDGSRLDRVFDATKAMRSMMEALRSGVASGTSVAHVDVRDLLKALEAESDGASLGAAEPPSEPPSSRAVTFFHEDAAGEPPPSLPLPAVRGDAHPSLSPPQRTAPRETDRAPEREPAERDRSAPQEVVPAAVGATKLRETLKVDVGRVDDVVEMVGELIIVQSMVVHSPEIATLGSLRLQSYLNQLSKISRDLQDVAMRMRMVPVRGVFKKLARMVRELGRKVQKDTVLVTSGEGTEMDRSMVERLEEPLVHMIRNSIDHGIEDASTRRTKDKPKVATIRLSAYHAAGSVIVEVADDGRGLSKDNILRKARENGLVREGETLSDAEIYNLIFAPGFSTAAQVTEISGRGVGMDVVKRTIEAMRGRVMIASTSGEGTVFRIVLPLTLAIIDGMLIACGKETYILPSLSIVESLRPKPSMLFSLGGSQELVSVRDELLPLVRLSRIFAIDGAEEDPTAALIVVVENLGRKVALLVDDVVDEQQVVIKSLDAGISGAENFSGAAILPDGRAGLILNVDRLGAIGGGGGYSPVRQWSGAELMG